MWSSLRALLGQESAYHFSSFSLHARDAVRIRVKGDGDCRVAQSLAHNFRVDTRPESEGRMGVTKVMEPDSRNLSGRDSSAEDLREAGRMDR